MCGLTGILAEDYCSRGQEQAIITWFTRLLVESEHRGPYATGMAVVQSDGTIHVKKAPLSASRFIHTTDYSDICAKAAACGAILMGHTRWPTQGSHRYNHNNQPLLLPDDPQVVLTHNGHIPMVDKYFTHFQLSRAWEVDSEVLLRLTSRHITTGGLSVPELLQDIAYCAGHIAAVLVVSSRPEEVIFIRRDKPLYIAYHSDMHLLAYASEETILKQALPSPNTWQIQLISANTAWVVNRKHLENPAVYRW